MNIIKQKHTLPLLLGLGIAKRIQFSAIPRNQSEVRVYRRLSFKSAPTMPATVPILIGVREAGTTVYTSTMVGSVKAPG